MRMPIRQADDPSLERWPAMVFEHIEQLKRQYTDKYVVVDDSRPELARFRGVTGIVKTVNMSGRALVEFGDYLANIGWYDIELDFLYVVPKPEPGAVAAHGEKPAAAKAAPVKPAVEKAAAAKPMVAKLAPAKAPAAGAVKAGGKASTADVLAALRAKKPAEPAAVSDPAVETAGAAETESEEQTTPEPPSIVEGDVEESVAIEAEPPAAVPIKSASKASAAKESAAKAGATVPGPGKPTTTAEIIAFCRLVDAKS